jgi:predicted metal-dependent phosphoesterase TrpH
LRLKFDRLNNFDLHNHTAASDGLLSPAALVDLAHRNGCDGLALTDHDTVDGLREADGAAQERRLRFIHGVEISVTWTPSREAKSTTLHIVGLGIDAENPQLAAGLESIREGRIARARRIGDDFARIGMPGMFDAAYALAENKSMLGRTHFARALVNAGRVTEVGKAFNRYLTPGRPGFVPHRWAALADAVSWIHAAGGIAVIAHPGRYKLSKAEMTGLMSEFKDLGGAAIEVVTGSHSPAQFREYAARAREFGFLASRGADFHGLEESHYQPGRLPPLPDDLLPVWNHLA